jgi:hypothetical protein
MDGRAVPDPCILSKSGKKHPKRVIWFADDKQHDIHVVFAGKSPFMKENMVIKNGGGGSQHTDDIKPEAEVRSYDYLATSEAKEIAADPQIIIKD